MDHHQFTRSRTLANRLCETRMLVALLLAASLHVSTTAAAEVYKCKGPKGEITFTNIKCPEKSQAQHYGTYQPVQDSPDQYYQATEQADAIRERNNGAAPSSRPHPSGQPSAAVSAAPLEPEGNIVRCTKPNGKVYFTRMACSASSVVVDSGGGAERVPSGPVYNSDGSINPDAHWTGPNQAIDASNGQFLQGADLQHPFNRNGPNARENVVSVPDRAEHVDQAAGCSGAKEAAQRVRARGGSFDARRKADDHVWDLCNRPANSTR